jgi:hypothetical protein
MLSHARQTLGRAICFRACAVYTQDSTWSYAGMEDFRKRPLYYTGAEQHSGFVRTVCLISYSCFRLDTTASATVAQDLAFHKEQQSRRPLPPNLPGPADNVRIPMLCARPGGQRRQSFPEPGAETRAADASKAPRAHKQSGVLCSRGHVGRSPGALLDKLAQ